MHKFCYLIVLLFVVNIALCDVDVNSISHNYSDSTEEFFTPIDDKNYIFSVHVSEPTMEQKILQRLDLIVNNFKVLVKENDKMNTMITSQNDLETIIRRVISNINVYPRNCMEATKLTRPSGLYGIQVENYSSVPFQVFCENILFGGGWTVIARRLDGTINFADRTWAEYKEGFGDLSGEFFIGMDKLYALTNGPRKQELIFVLRDFEKNQKYAKYSEFAIGDESEGYKIKILGYYSGNAGDSFWYHRYQTFKTKDRDTSTNNCTKYGAGWYNDCHWSNLFGLYLHAHVNISYNAKGIVWASWTGNSYSLKFVQMMIRPKST